VIGLNQSEAAQAWAEYLASKGHKVEQEVEFLISRNSTRKRFHWLVYASGRARKAFGRAELSRIRNLLSRCQRSDRSVYVVVCFSRPERKFVAACAQYVLENKELYADKGGILF
jgi:hypothetical protein